MFHFLATLGFGTLEYDFMDSSAEIDSFEFGFVASIAMVLFGSMPQRKWCFIRSLSYICMIELELNRVPESLSGFDGT